MKKIICLVFAFFAMSSTSNAQTISMIGDGVVNWSTDVPMTTSDNNIYTLSNYTFKDGSAKFRRNASWAFNDNWGASQFPMGTGNPGGANIPTVAGVYDVTFNLTTKEYKFTAVVQGFTDISVYGTGNSNVDAEMSTADGITYRLNNYEVGLGELVFRQDMANTNTWGSASFPSGTATSGGAAINVTPGRYNITFNLNTGAYSFTFPKISIIGSGLAGWGTDTDMTTDDGINYLMTLTAFSNGGIKFRQDNQWAFNWGGGTFPGGTATLNGGDINTVAGNWFVAFNRVTGAWSFSSTYPKISLYNGTTDVDMITGDGVIYSLATYTFTAGSYKFRQANDNVFVWGGPTFPTGTAETYITSGISVPGNTYNVTFNKTTGAYAFTYNTISIIGDATPGAWAADTTMSTTDGINYTITGITLTDGAVKFRRDYSWTRNWGSNAFPSGTGTQNGSDIPLSASRYNISFNMQTGAYVFSDLLRTKVRSLQCGITLSALNTDILADFISGATEYRFKVVANGTTEVLERGSNRFFNLTMLTGGAAFNTAYTISVSIKVGGVWGSYGSECVVSTPTAMPVSKVRALQCGATLPALNRDIIADYLQFATDYRFKVVANGTTEEIERGNRRFFNLTMLTAGAVYNTAYTVSVAVKHNGVWGSYGAECVVSTPTVPVTKIRTLQCGATLTALNTDILADWMQFATDYRFKVVANGTTEEIERGNNRFFNLTMLTGGALYNTAYTVSVAVKHDGVWGAYGAECVVSTPAAPVSKIRTLQCGATLAALNTDIIADFLQFATDYRFKVVANGTTEVIERGNVRSFNLTMLTGGVNFNTAYTISVGAKHNGVWGAYGAECFVLTPTIATTKVRALQCGATLPTISTDILADFLPFATAYRFKVEVGGAGYIVSAAGNNRFFKLTSLPVTITAGTDYTVAVAVQQNGAWGDYGTDCIVRTPGTSSTSRLIASTNDYFSLVAYPNPSNSMFNLKINGANNENVSILVFDMTGRQIENKVVKANDIENISLGQNYSNGIYNVIVSQGVNTKTVRLVKN